MLKNILGALFLTLLAAASGAQPPGSNTQPPLSTTGQPIPTAQHPVSISRGIPAILTKDTTQILSALDSFFTHSDQSVSHIPRQLINFYPLDKDQYWVTVSCSDSTFLFQIRTFIANRNSTGFVLTSPLHYLTRDWHTTQVGHITYHYPDSINLVRAHGFDGKNDTIASKLGLTAENFDFYLTDNYQHILALQGYEFDALRAGRTRDGSFTGQHQFFAIQHNEDFSHDLIHYYVSRVRTNTRNSAAEEGLAYYWGNAYYTDSTGNMIDYPAQLAALRGYEHQHPDTSLLSLFEHNAKPFPKLAPEVSARSILSARLFELIETTHGIDGIKTLINCGPGDDNYFKAVEDLTGITRTNFDTRLRTLLNP